jgi:hypothetical protein
MPGLRLNSVGDVMMRNLVALTEPIRGKRWETGDHYAVVLSKLNVDDSAHAGAPTPRNAVPPARRAGWSWGRIGAAAGISADRAAQRWDAASDSCAVRTQSAPPRGQWPPR